MDYDLSWREATFLLPFQSSLESRYLKTLKRLILGQGQVWNIPWWLRYYPNAFLIYAWSPMEEQVYFLPGPQYKAL